MCDRAVPTQAILPSGDLCCRYLKPLAPPDQHYRHPSRHGPRGAGQLATGVEQEAWRLIWRPL